MRSFWAVGERRDSSPLVVCDVVRPMMVGGVLGLPTPALLRNRPPSPAHVRDGPAITDDELITSYEVVSWSIGGPRRGPKLS